MKMKRYVLAMCFFAMIIVLRPVAPLCGENTLKMSTTTSTQASGLLDVILPEFKKDAQIDVKVIAKGTGAALRDGVDGNVDIVFVHAKDLEEQFIQDGYGTKRYAVMHNDFVILGPASDPAGIKKMTSAIDAFLKIAATQSTFVSRGDDSGTHTKEQALWKTTGLGLDKENRPSGSKHWYVSIGQGMGKTITFANEKQAYTLADRGTFIKYKFGQDIPVDLDILCEKDSLLTNPYGLIPVNPEKHPHVKYDLAQMFVQWLVSEKGQHLIAGYRICGQQLFYPDALSNK
jgi:tungstate transport system substrate-binding protein